MFSNVQSRMYFYLCGFALCLSLSMAGGNFFLVLITIETLIQLCKKNERKKLFAKFLTTINDKKFLFAIAFLFFALLCSIPFAKFPLISLQRFFAQEVFRFILFFAAICFIDEREKIFRIIHCLTLSMVLNSFVSFYKAFFVYSSDPWSHRLAGFIGYMPFSTLLSVALSLCLLTIVISKNKRQRMYCSFLFVIFFISILLTWTRGAWAACLATTGLMFFQFIQNKKKFFIGLGAACCALAIFASSSSIVSTRWQITQKELQSGRYERFLLWQSAYQMFLDHPVTGVGWSNFQKVYPTEYISPLAKEPNLVHAHNTFLQFLAECGLIGALAFLNFWIYATWYAVSNFHRNKSLPDLVIFVLITTVMLHGLTECTFFNTAITMKFFWLVLGLCFVYKRLSPVEKISS